MRFSGHAFRAGDSIYLITTLELAAFIEASTYAMPFIIVARASRLCDFIAYNVFLRLPTYIYSLYYTMNFIRLHNNLTVADGMPKESSLARASSGSIYTYNACVGKYMYTHASARSPLDFSPWTRLSRICALRRVGCRKCNYRIPAATAGPLHFSPAFCMQCTLLSISLSLVHSIYLVYSLSLPCLHSPLWPRLRSQGFAAPMLHRCLCIYYLSSLRQLRFLRSFFASFQRKLCDTEFWSFCQNVLNMCFEVIESKVHCFWKMFVACRVCVLQPISAVAASIFTLEVSFFLS